MGGSRGWIAALLLATSVPAHAEIYRFDSELIPASRTLVGKYMFYVYSHQDSPDKSKGHPYVQFTDFDIEELDHADGSAPKVANGSIQVSLVPWKDFEVLVDHNHFCSCPNDVEQKVAKAEKQLVLLGLNGTIDNNSNDVHVYTVGDAEGRLSSKPGKETAGRQALKHTGVYLLAISNCGDDVEVTISGNVIVRNSFGFLSGIEYGKKMVYVVVSTAYFVMTVCWTGLCVQHSEDLIFTHRCLFAVLVASLVEAVLWYIHLVEVNSSGDTSRFLMTAAMLFSGLKQVLLGTLVLVTAMGKGVTTPTLEAKSTMRIVTFASIFIIFNYSRIYIMEMRHRYSLSVNYTALAWGPTLVLAAFFVCWICSSISSTKSALQEQGQTIKLAQFSRFQVVFCLTVPLGLAMFGLQLVDLPGRTSDWWSYHWMFGDAAASGLGILFCAAMMVLWAPTEGGKRQAFSQQITARDDDEAGFGPEGFGSADAGPVEVAEQMGPEPDRIGATIKDEV